MTGLPTTLTFSEYQDKAVSLAVYPNVGKNYNYPLKGLFGEAGEVAEKLKKIERDKNGVVNAEDRQEIGKELGDVLWYISALAMEFGFDLGQVAQANLDKLQSRKDRGVLQGSGDNR